MSLQFGHTPLSLKLSVLAALTLASGCSPAQAPPTLEGDAPLPNIKENKVVTTRSDLLDAASSPSYQASQNKNPEHKVEDTNRANDYVPENAVLNVHRLPLKNGFKIITWPSSDTLFSEQFWDEYGQSNKENPIRFYNVKHERKCKWIKLFNQDRTENIQIKSDLCNFGDRRGVFQALDQKIKSENINVFSHCIDETPCDITMEVAQKVPYAHNLIPEISGYRTFVNYGVSVTNLKAFILQSEHENLVLYNQVWDSKYYSDWYGYFSGGGSLILSSKRAPIKTPTQSQLFYKVNEILTAK